jgi:hypothetical protein
MSIVKESWTPDQIQAVWNKGTRVQNQDANEWRKDACEAWIGRKFYGKRDSKYGWEIHHIDPKGGDDISNLAPLQWQNNVATSDGPLKCVMTSSGIDNIPTQ